MEVTFEIRGDAKVVAYLQSIPQKVQAELLRAITALTYELQSYIQTTKLSGGLLNVRSGALRSSIFTEVTQGSNYIQGRVMVPKGQVPYAGIQEYGGTIAHPGGTPYRVIDGRAVFVPLSAAAASLPRTAAHSIVIPERSYMRSSLAERRPEIVATIRDAVKLGLA